MKPKYFLLITTLSVLALIRPSFAGIPVFQKGGSQLQTNQLDVGWNSTPAQVDWDRDGLRDLVIGDKEGYIWFYRNMGTEFNPIFTTGEKIKYISSNNPIDVEEFATPFVIEFDNNGFYDLIVGNKNGIITRFPMSANPPYVGTPTQISYTNNTLRGVYFLDNNSGWIVGDNGIIFHTVDGGLTWIPDQSNTTENINSVHFLSSNEGWAVGNKSTILRYYIPAGKNEPVWESKTYGTPTNFHSCYFVDSNNGWAVGDKGVIMRYANGSWTTQTSGITVDLQSVFFIDSQTGWIVGNSSGANGTILQTTNGGTAWTLVTINPTDLYSITRPPGTTTLWAVGANGIILRSTDTTTWATVTSPVNTNLYSVHFSDPDTGWIAGADGIVLQYANGTWVNVPSGVSANLYSVLVNDATHNWAVGDKSTIRFYDGIQWGTQSLDIDIGFYSAPFIFDLDEDGKKDLFIGDDPGNVWFFKNVGSDDVPAFRYGFRMNVGSQSTGTSSNFLDVGQFATPQITDWNGDGTKDLIVGNGEGNVFFFKGVATTGSQTQGVIPLPGNRILTFDIGVKIQANKLDIDVGQRSAPLVMDWNKDGGFDLVIGVECGVIHLFLNDTPFQPPQFTLSSKVQGSPLTSLQIGLYSTPAIIDFDDDSRKDLFVGDEDGFVTLFLNSGTDKEPIFTGGFELKVFGTSAEKGTFTENLDAGEFSRPYPVDWNNDGKKDIIVGNSLGQVTYFRNIQSDRSPLFASGAIIQMGIGSPTKTALDVGAYATPVVVDWNNDGKKDLIIGNSDGNIYGCLNIGTDENPALGTLTKLSTLESDIDVGGYAIPFVVDYNGDHNKDLVVGDADGYITLFLNIGTDKTPIWDKGKRLRIEGSGDIDAGENAAPWVVDYDNSNSLVLVVGNKAGFVNLYFSAGIVDLYITKSVDKTCVYPGEIITYTIEYGNRGNFNATNVEITDEVPPLTEFIGPAQGDNLTIRYFTNGTWTDQYSTATTKIKWLRNELSHGAVGQKVSFTVRVVGTGTISNFADIKSDQTYLQMSNIVTVIGTDVGLPDFSTAKKSVVPEGEVLPGTVLTFTIKYQNTGNGTATNVLISDVIDINLCDIKNISNGGVYANGEITWNLGIILPGYGGEVRFNATVFAPLPAGIVIENMATLTADGGFFWQTNKVQLTIPQTDSEGDDWPMFHFNLSHEGYDLTEVIRPPLQLKGSCSVGSLIFSSPIIVDERLYIGSYGNNKIFVFDAQSMTLLGSYTVNPGGIDSTPAIVGNRLYAGDYKGRVYCWGTTTSDLKWSTQLGINVNIHFSSPVVADGILYIGGKNNLYALSITDGSIKWIYPTNKEIQSSPAVANGRVYFGSGDGNLYCLTTDGAFQWKFGTVGAIYSSPAVKDGVVYVGSNDKNIYAIDAYSGVLKWQYPTNGEVHSSPAIANGVIFCGSQDGYLYALNQDGTYKWSHLIGRSIESSPAVANGVVYFGADDGKVYGLDVDNGNELWKYNTGPKRIYSSPAIVDGVLYIASSDGKIYAFTSHADFSNDNLNKKLNSPGGIVTAGDEITYTIKFYNEGLGEATNFRIEDTLDPSLEFGTASDNAVYFSTTRLVTWNMGTIGVNSGGSVILRVRIGTNTPNNTIVTNRAKFSWEISLSKETNMVTNQVIKEIITVLKVCNKNSVTPEETVFYTISYKNNGSSTITGINIVDKVSPYLTNINPANGGKNEGGTITWSIGNLPPNANGEVHFNSDVVSPLTNNTFISNNTAQFNATQISTSILAQPGTLTVNSPDFRTSTKTVSGTFIPGGMLTYTIKYINTGSLSATGVKIWDVVDKNLIIATISTGGSYNQNNRTIEWNLGQTNSGSVSFKATITTPLANGTLIKNKATIQASYMPNFVTDEIIGTVSSTPDFRYSTKEVSPRDGIPLNKILTYTINYHNTGSMDAEDVMVIDRLDPHLSVSTVTSYAEVITGPGTINLKVDNGWTQFNNGTVNGNITIVTPNGTHTTSIGNYSQVQLLIDNINNNMTARVNISYDPNTDKFTLQSLDGCIIGLYESGTNPFFTAIKIPTGIYCSGNYSNGTLTWDIGQVKVGEGGSVTFKAMVLGTPTKVSNRAEISFFGTTCLTSEVSNTVDTTPPPIGSPPIEGSSTIDLDADIDGNYTIYWQAWDDSDSGIAMYEIQECRLDEISWTTLSNTIPGNTRYFAVSNREKGKTYYYRLRAMNGAGTWSAYSNPSDGICIVDQLKIINPATTTIITLSAVPLSSPLIKEGRELFDSKSGQIVVQIPKGAFVSTVTFTIRKVTPPTTDFNKSSPIIDAVLDNSAYELKALKEDYHGVEVQPTNPIIVTLPYSDPDINKEDDDRAYRIYRLAGDHWEIIPGKQTIDSNNDLVTTHEVKQLSIFAVAAPTTHLQKVLVRPNPFKSRLGHENVKFENLSGKVNLWIYNIAGELVFNKDNITGTYYEWSIINNEGDRVASGVYIYIITNELGEKVTGKVAIIK